MRSEPIGAGEKMGRRGNRKEGKRRKWKEYKEDSEKESTEKDHMIIKPKQTPPP